MMWTMLGRRPEAWRVASILATVLTVGGPGLLASVATAQESPRAEGDSGVAPMMALPWDGIPLTSRKDMEVLNLGFDLGRRGRAGEERRYEIRRVNTNLDRVGMPLTRMVIEGTVREILLREVDRGRWEVRFVWERFALGQSTAGSAPAVREVAAARGIDYTVEPSGLDAVNPEADFGRLGPGLEAMLMKVLAVDMHAWNALVLGMRSDIGDTVFIGDVGRLADAPESVDLTGPDTSKSMVTYDFGESRLAVVGLTRRGGEPCVVIWFSMEGSQVIQNIEPPPVTLRMEGSEYFNGMLSVSLLDGRIVAGQLWGVVPSRMSVGLPGQEVEEQPIFAVLQEVVMWEAREE